MPPYEAIETSLYPECVIRLQKKTENTGRKPEIWVILRENGFEAVESVMHSLKTSDLFNCG